MHGDEAEILYSFSYIVGTENSPASAKGCFKAIKTLIHITRLVSA